MLSFTYFSPSAESFTGSVCVSETVITVPDGPGPVRLLVTTDCSGSGLLAR